MEEKKPETSGGVAVIITVLIFWGLYSGASHLLGSKDVPQEKVQAMPEAAAASEYGFRKDCEREISSRLARATASQTGTFDLGRESSFEGRYRLAGTYRTNYPLESKTGFECAVEGGKVTVTVYDTFLYDKEGKPYL